MKVKTTEVLISRRCCGTRMQAFSVNETWKYRCDICGNKFRIDNDYPMTVRVIIHG